MRMYRVILPVGDIDRAAQFYESLLDMTGQRVAPGRHYLMTGETVLALVDPQVDGQDRDARPNQEHVYFSTTELAPAWARAEALVGPDGGLTDIRDRPWGERSFYVADPWGNPLCIVEHGSEFTEGWVP